MNNPSKKLIELKEGGTHPYRLTTFARPSRVPSLNHKPFDVAMKNASIVGPTRTQGKKVLWGRVGEWGGIDNQYQS